LPSLPVKRGSGPFRLTYFAWFRSSAAGGWKMPFGIACPRRLQAFADVVGLIANC
jgi:hypothetical protein